MKWVRIFPVLKNEQRGIEHCVNWPITQISPYNIKIEILVIQINQLEIIKKTSKNHFVLLICGSFMLY